MSFDKNNESPEQIVDPGKRTTKVNIAVAIGVVIFLIAMALFVTKVAKDPPQDPGEATSLPGQSEGN